MHCVVDAEGGCGCVGRRHDEEAGCAPPIGAPREPLSAEARQALLAALDDEYRSHAFYLAVLKKFPYAWPFTHIVESEQRHAAALTRILEAYGVPAPANDHIGSADIQRSVPPSLACACDIAAQEERDNDRLYGEHLIPKVSAYPIIAQAFERLRLASRECHLPAFASFADAYRMKKPLEQAPA
jgi:hypothetical protein